MFDLPLQFYDLIWLQFWNQLRRFFVLLIKKFDLFFNIGRSEK